MDEEAAPNGSLMRLAPVAIRWSHDRDAVVAMAAASSRTTHAATRPVDACRVLAAMTAALIRGEQWEQVSGPDFWTHGPLHHEVAAVARGSWRGKEPPAIKGSNYCVEALEAAIWAVDGAGDFATAVLRAANLGDDADTTAAIAGQLAGARFGESGIPWLWLEILAMRPRIQSLADAGIDTIIDLTRDDDGLSSYADRWSEIGVARGRRLDRIHHPIMDLGVTTPEGYDAIVADMEKELGAGRSVYVHCWGGVGRTGTVVGCWHVSRGATAADALAAIARVRRGTRKAKATAPEMPCQVEAIHEAERRGSRNPLPPTPSSAG